VATATGASIIGTALQQLGVLGSGGSATTQQNTDGLVFLIAMIDNANGDPKMAISSTRTSFNLTSGVATYTIGPGQTINVARPSKILAASCTQGSGLTMPVRVFQNSLEFSSIVDANQASHLIRNLWYDRGNTTGTVYLSPKPYASAGSIAITYPTLITNFSDTTTPVEIPPAYIEWMRFGLAVELAGSYDMPVPESVASAYQRSMGVIQGLNAELLGPTMPPIPATGKTVEA
jgi:hypothetical protein